MTGQAPEPGLWEFSVRLYAHEAVKASALALQDAGLDVNIAFWIVWSTGHGRDPVAVLDTAMALTGQWHALATGPLRSVRDGLKAPGAAVPPDAARTLRHSVLDAELAAEKIAQTLLENLDLPRRPGDTPWSAVAQAALESYAARMQVTAPVAPFKEAVFLTRKKE